jgi:hypothetical protein
MVQSFHETVHDAAVERTHDLGMIEGRPAERTMAHQQLPVVRVGVDCETDIDHRLLDGGEHRVKTGCLGQIQGACQFDAVLATNLSGDFGRSYRFKPLNNPNEEVGQ